MEMKVNERLIKCEQDVSIKAFVEVVER